MRVEGRGYELRGIYCTEVGGSLKVDKVGINIGDDWDVIENEMFGGGPIVGIERYLPYGYAFSVS